MRVVGAKATVTVTVNGGPPRETEIPELPATDGFEWVVGADCERLSVRNLRLTDLTNPGDGGKK